MKTTVVATDFSEAAHNAARCAASLTRQIPVNRIILYHSYFSMIATDTPLPDSDYYRDLQEDSMNSLNDLKSLLKPLAANGVVIECLANISSLQEAIHIDFVKENIDLIVMGVTGESKLKEKIMGSQAVMAAKQTTIPLLLIPFDATYKTIKRAVFASDMEDSEKTFPRQMFKDILQVLKAELLVLNIDYNNKKFSESTIKEQTIMHQILDPENATYFYGSHPDASRGIIAFAESRYVDLVMIIPKKKTFPENLFKKSTTRKLAFHIKTPLLILPHRK